MKKIHAITYVIISLLNIINVKSQTNIPKILFIGNSITYYNNMPQTFESIANSFNDSVNVTVYAPGGTGIIDHVNDANVYALFRQACWDYFILQPGSNESPGYSYPIDLTLARVYTLLDSLYKYNPCVKVLYYQIPYGVYGTSQNDLTSYNNTMDLILSNNKYLADSTKSFFAPVGEAFRTSWNNDTTNMLWTGFLSVHPNIKGSYIAACVFYASIFNKESHGTTEISSLSQQEADSCQLLADSIVLNNLTEWRINVYNQITDFNYSINNDTIFFYNLSQNFDSVYWNFGDNTFSTDTNPYHIYQNQGNYTITLTTYIHSCQQNTYKQINITNTKNNLSSNKINIFPNPAKNNLIINTNDNNLQVSEIYIYNNTGEIVKKIYINKTLNKVNIDINNLSKGLYFIHIKNSKNIYINKFVKQ